MAYDKDKATIVQAGTVISHKVGTNKLVHIKARVTSGSFKFVVPNHIAPHFPVGHSVAITITPGEED